MGIDISGGMFVGCKADELCYDDTVFSDLDDYIEHFSLDRFSPYFDADIEDNYVGYGVPDVKVSEIDKWVVKVKEKAKKFEDETGCKASLIGMQDVW